jgi:hypothetical protein
MKAILEFNLPEDQPEFNNAIKGGDWKHVCWQMDQYLRKRVKYDDGLTEEQLEVYEDMRGEFWRMMKESNLDLYEAE